jgi:lipopolysaccharide core galacturonosyltransferase RgtB
MQYDNKEEGRLHKQKEGSSPNWSGGRNTPFLGKKDLPAAGIIFLYCCLFAVLRLSVSSTMELDEAEQFLNGYFFSLGYAHQPPFYSWIVYGMSMLFGMNIETLTVTKYAIMFFFYFSFYLIARSFWNIRASLLMTGTLLFFPTYSYEFNRDLSHSVLVAAMASITCYLFVRLLRQERPADYLLFGVAIGLGFLSKYNFAFFLSALILAAASFHEGRGVLFNKRIFLSLAACILIVSPHVLWLVQNDFLPFRHAMTKADTGTLQLSSVQEIFNIIASSYSGVLIFLVIFLVFFGFRLSRDDSRSRSTLCLRLFRYLAVYGLTIPFLVISVLRTGHFSERWLAPLLFILPLAVFSAVDTEANIHRFRLLGYLSIFIAVAILVARSFIGFFPDLAGKVERIHTPFSYVSLQLKQELEEKGIDDLRDLTIIANNEFLAANMVSCLPGAKSFLTGGAHSMVKDVVKTRAKVILWDARKQGADVPEEFARQFPSAHPLRTFRASFLRSSKFPPFAIGAALVK